MQHFFREAAAKSGHPAPKLMMTDPYGIFGIFKAQSMQPEHAEWLDACRKLAEKGDLDAVTALYTVTDLPEAELKRYLAPLEKKAASGDQDALAQLAFIRVDWLKEDPGKVLESLEKHRKNAKPVLLARMGELALSLGGGPSGNDPDGREWRNMAVQPLSQAAEKGHAAAMRLLAEMTKGTAAEQSGKLLAELRSRGALEPLLGDLSGCMKEKRGTVDGYLLQTLFDQARKLGSNNAYAWYAQLVSEAKPPQEQELRKAALDLLALHDERGMPFLKEPLSLPQKKLNQLPPYAKTHKELELASQLGDADSSVQLGELWKEELANTMDSIGKAHEAQENMRTWYKQAAEEGHPLAKLRLAQMENPDLMDKPAAEPARTLLNDCLAKAASGDFITLRHFRIRHAGTVGGADRQPPQKSSGRGRPQPGGPGLPDAVQLQERGIRLSGSPGLGPAFRRTGGSLRHVRAGPRPYLRIWLGKTHGGRGFLDVPGGPEGPCGRGGHVELQ